MRDGLARALRGHFYNWYDTQTLQPLLPMYVSTVDSGNLAAHLLTLRVGLLALPDDPIVGRRVFDGLADTLGVLRDSRAAQATPAHAEFRREPSAPRGRRYVPATTRVDGSIGWSSSPTDRRADGRSAQVEGPRSDVPQTGCRRCANSARPRATNSPSRAVDIVAGATGGLEALLPPAASRRCGRSRRYEAPLLPA